LRTIKSAENDLIGGRISLDRHFIERQFNHPARRLPRAAGDTKSISAAETTDLVAIAGFADRD
jgi:hypothetical protein